MGESIARTYPPLGVNFQEFLQKVVAFLSQYIRVCLAVGSQIGSVLRTRPIPIKVHLIAWHPVFLGRKPELKEYLVQHLDLCISVKERVEAS